jgi:hypothetical protein
VSATCPNGKTRSRREIGSQSPVSLGPCRASFHRAFCLEPLSRPPARDRFLLAGPSNSRKSLGPFAYYPRQTSLQKSLITRKQSTGLALAHQVFGFAVGTAVRLSERVPGTRLVQERHPLVTTHGRPARCDARHWLRIAAMRTLIARRFATK